MYGRKPDGAPPYAVGVSHFTQDADEVAAFLADPANMHRWNDELCEKGEASSSHAPQGIVPRLFERR